MFIWRDKYGYPVESIAGRPVMSFIRLLLHTSVWESLFCWIEWF